MTIVDIEEAKTNLHDLIARAEAGEDVVIGLDGKPAVRLVALHHNPRKRILGLNAGPRSWIADDFDAPMADEADWYADIDMTPDGGVDKSAK